MDDHYNVPCLMAVLTSDCMGMAIRNLRVGTRKRTVWNTGAFSTAMLSGWCEKPENTLPLLGAVVCSSDLRFEVECIKPGDSGARDVAVNLRLYESSYGALNTVLSVACSPEIFKELDFEQIGYDFASRHDVGGPDMFVVYIDQNEQKTLAEDIPRCRELTSRLCRELTAQLSAHRYCLRAQGNCT